MLESLVDKNTEISINNNNTHAKYMIYTRMFVIGRYYIGLNLLLIQLARINQDTIRLINIKSHTLFYTLNLYLAIFFFNNVFIFFFFFNISHLIYIIIIIIIIIIISSSSSSSSSSSNSSSSSSSSSSSRA